MSASVIALSGAHAASLRLDTAAHNVANVDTPDFRRQQTLQRTLEPAGVATSVTQSDTTGSALERDLIDWTKPLRVNINGAPAIGYQPKVLEPDLHVMFEELYRTGDRKMLFLGKVEVNGPG